MYTVWHHHHNNYTHRSKTSTDDSSCPQILGNDVEANPYLKVNGEVCVCYGCWTLTGVYEMHDQMHPKHPGQLTPCNYLPVCMTPFHHCPTLQSPTASCSQQTAYKKLWLLGMQCPTLNTCTCDDMTRIFLMHAHATQKQYITVYMYYSYIWTTWSCMWWCKSAVYNIARSNYSSHSNVLTCTKLHWGPCTISGFTIVITMTVCYM